MPPASPPTPRPSVTATTPGSATRPQFGTARCRPAPASPLPPGPAAVHVRTFPARPREAGRARAWLTGVLSENPAADDAIADDALLCLSELAANAITHSNSRRPGGTFTATTTITADSLRIEITDHGGPWRNHHAQPGETGRGLQIVTQLATRSGITGTGRHSRTVWLEIDYPGNRTPEQAITSPDPATAATADARAAARDLLIQTAELPRDRRQLETIITQYRALLRALAITPGKL